MNRLQFEKTGNGMFISHLDLIRVFQRAFRRAGMLLKHSQGYTPHAYVSILLPLPVGMSSQCEILDFELDESDTTDLRLVPELLNRTLPSGIRVIRCYDSPRKAGELAFLRARLTLEYDRGVTGEQEAALRELLSREQIPVEKKTKSKALVTQNIREMIQSWQLRSDQNTIVLDCLVCAQNPSLNPMQIVKAITIHAPQAAPDFAGCHRLELLDANGNPFA